MSINCRYNNGDPQVIDRLFDKTMMNYPVDWDDMNEMKMSPTDKDFEITSWRNWSHIETGYKAFLT